MGIKINSVDYFPFLDSRILHSRLSWSIRLRWLAVVGFFLASLAAKLTFELNIPFDKIWTALIILAIINLVYLISLKVFKEFSFTAELVIMFIHIAIDLFFLTLLIHYSGGIENPIYLFYIFHIVLSSIIFPRFIPFIFATFVVVLFSALVFLEYNGVIYHYSLFNVNIFNNPLALTLVLTVFVITIFVTEYICTTFMKIYRDSKRIIDQQNKQLIESDKQKSQFFRFASHELKAPIIAIKSSIDGILKTFSGRMDEKAVNLLTRASMRSAQMLAIIKELLELSKNRNLPVKTQRSAIAINAVIEYVIQQEKVLIEQKNIDIELHLNKQEIEILGLEEDIYTIFLNLINNAVRYSSENGKVKVDSFIEGSRIIVTVEDFGIGISEKDLDKIFEEFYRSENAKKVVNFGTGLGLSLVKQIVENYNGEISVISKINEGTTFKVSFPIESSQN